LTDSIEPFRVAKGAGQRGDEQQPLSEKILQAVEEGTSPACARNVPRARLRDQRKQKGSNPRRNPVKR
jgi:hypothetical protein